MPTSPPAIHPAKRQTQTVFKKQVSSALEITIKEAVKSPDKSLRFLQSHLYLFSTVNQPINQLTNLLTTNYVAADICFLLTPPNTNNEVNDCNNNENDDAIEQQQAEEFLASQDAAASHDAAEAAIFEAATISSTN